MLKDFGGFDNLLSYKIFLERYASKDDKKNIKVDDLVVCLVNPKEGIGNRELGIVTNIENDKVEVKLLTGFEIVQGKSKSLVDTLRTFNINFIDRLKETYAQEMHDRIAYAVALKTELQEDNYNPETVEDHYKTYKDILSNWNFIPAGRMLIGLGYNEKLSLFNCYVIPNPKDSREGINNTLGYMTELMSRGGGVGINLSSLRPRGANVLGVCGRSSGAVSWGDEYSRRTGRVEQGGCIIGSTLIATEKGNIPIKDLVGKKPWIYTYNLENKKIELKQTKWIGKTGTQKEVWKLTTDKGLILYATPDHKILLRTGEYKELKDIKIGQRIMPLIRYWQRNKEPAVRTILGDASKKKIWSSDIPIHRFIYSQVYNTQLTSEDCIHHIDGNHFNNDINNLKLTSKSDHSYKHAKDKVREGNHIFLTYSKSLSTEERKKRAKIGGDYAKAIMNGDMGEEYQKWYLKRISHKACTDNAMHYKEAKIKNAKSNAITAAYKLLNANEDISTPTLWDKALYNNRIESRTGIVHGVGVNPFVPRSWKIEKLFNNYEEFLQIVNNNNHKIVSIEYSHKEDVYDLEVPTTHNFAVIQDKEDIASSGIFIHNSRRGACILMLNDWHPDLLELIEAKQQSQKMKQVLQQLSDEERKSLKVPLENCNISIGVSDSFIQAIADDTEWNLEFPDTTTKNYTDIWDGDLQAWKAKGYKTIIYKTLKARELWHTITESAWQSGEPGVVFLERYNKLANSSYYPEGKIIGVNPCIVGDTLIAVADGRQAVSIKQLAEEGKDVPVFCNDKKGNTRIRWGRNPRKTKNNTEIYKVTLDDGSIMRLTPDHKVIMRNGSEKEVKDLKFGDSLMSFVKGRFKDLNRDDWFVNSIDGRQDCKWLESYLLAEFVEGRFPEPFPAEVVHHKNGNHWDNKSENIEIKTNKNHSKNHSSGSGNAMYGKQYSEETKSKIAISSQKRFSDDNWKQHFSNAVKKGVNNPESKIKFRKKVSERASNWALRQGKWILENFGSIDPSKWVDHKEAFKKATGLKAVNSWVVEDRFTNWEEFIKAASDYNHKVISVEFDGYADVYNITVDEFHTYAIVTNNKYKVRKMKTSRIGGIIVRNCGEQGLSAHAACDLGHLNLPKFLRKSFIDFNHVNDKKEQLNKIIEYVDWDKLQKTIKVAVRFLDNIYNIAHFVKKEQEYVVRGERRIGLGTLGLAEMLIRLGITYGNNEVCLTFLDYLYKFIQLTAYKASIELSKNFGAFSFCDKEKHSNLYMVQKLGLQKEIKEYGIRNVTLTTQAPTGTVGTMLNTSTGIEPFPFFEWVRKSNIGEHKDYAKVVVEWKENNPNQGLPSFFVSAMGPNAISPEDHAAVQTAIQQWTDSSISKTCNLPEKSTVKDVATFFERLYQKGAKGGTIYRDNCRDQQVIMNTKDSRIIHNKENIKRVDYRTAPPLIGRPSWTVCISTAMGKMYVTISFFKGPYEIFVLVGKAGSELYAHCEALGRTMSLFLQLSSHVEPVDRLRILLKNLKDVGGTNIIGFGENKIKSIPDGVSKAIELFLRQYPDGIIENDKNIVEPEVIKENKDFKSINMDICPSCRSFTLVHESGCEHCQCGYSKC